MKLTLYILALFGFTACSSKPGSATKPITADDLLQASDFWTLVHCDYFLDGGSVTLSFLGRDGEIIHVWAKAPILISGEDTPPRRFFLKRTYNDPAAVELLPGSEVEQRVIALLSSCHYQPQPKNIFKPLPKLCISMIRDRNMEPPAGWPPYEAVLLPPSTDADPK